MLNFDIAWWQYLTMAVVAYLFGSVNYSIIFSRALRKKDIRTAGSGNAGTTNMFRTFGPLMGILAFVCDFLKGFILSFSVYHIALAQQSVFDQQSAEFALAFTALFVIIGHVFPVYYKFKGGKGFATFIGVMVSIQPLFIAYGLLPFFIVLILIDRMSIVALLTVVTCTIYIWILYYAVNLPLCIVFTLIAVFIMFAHRANIKRIFTGKELPMGIRKYFNPNRKKKQQAEQQKTDSIDETSAIDSNDDSAVQQGQELTDNSQNNVDDNETNEQK